MRKKSMGHSESAHSATEHGSSPTWFEKTGNVRLLQIVLILVCVLLVAVDFVYANPHPHFELEEVPGFYAAFGFVAFVVIVFLGRFLRLFVSRPEGYYDR